MSGEFEQTFLGLLDDAETARQLVQLDDQSRVFRLALVSKGPDDRFFNGVRDARSFMV
jgi:hypothetical protein